MNRSKQQSAPRSLWSLLIEAIWIAIFALILYLLDAGIYGAR